MENQQPKPDNNMVWAIICTLLCCLPLGIASIVYATKVDGLYAAGNYEAAKNASEQSKKFSKWGMISAAVIIVIYVIIAVVFGASAIALSH